MLIPTLFLVSLLIPLTGKNNDLSSFLCMLNDLPRSIDFLEGSMKLILVWFVLLNFDDDKGLTPQKTCRISSMILGGKELFGLILGAVMYIGLFRILSTLLSKSSSGKGNDVYDCILCFDMLLEPTFSISSSASWPFNLSIWWFSKFSVVLKLILELRLLGLRVAVLGRKLELRCLAKLIILWDPFNLCFISKANSVLFKALWNSFY